MVTSSLNENIHGSAGKQVVTPPSQQAYEHMFNECLDWQPSQFINIVGKDDAVVAIGRGKDGYRNSFAVYYSFPFFSLSLHPCIQTVTTRQVLAVQVCPLPSFLLLCIAFPPPLTPAQPDQRSSTDPRRRERFILPPCIFASWLLKASACNKEPYI